MNLNLATLMIFMPSAALALAQVDSFSTTSSAGPATTLARNDGRMSRDGNDHRSWAHATGRDYGRDSDDAAGPFTREEARALREVWSTIREAENFYDINWREIGLARAPGDRDARRFMAEHWGSLRRAAEFDDINWRAEYHRR